MLISHRKKFIYTKTVKTAGTSVESYFEKYCMPEGEWVFSHRREEYVSDSGIIGSREKDINRKTWYNHMPAIDIKEKIGDSIWNQYFKFCIIRNPFDKMLSYFFYDRKDNSPTNLIDEFKFWLKNNRQAIDRNLYQIDNEICMDYFIRYEEIKTGIKNVCEHLDIPFEPDRIPKLKTGFRNTKIPIPEFYDQETIGIINEMFDFEINYFNYKLPE